MSWRDDLAAEPFRHDFFWTLARFEALNPSKPKLGHSVTRREEFLDLGQVPFLDFPASTIATFDPGSAGSKPRIRVKFLGLMGPMGPLPLTTTEEAYRWYRNSQQLNGGDAFTRFCDIFNNRFLQMFYRAHADVRPAQHMRQPLKDRFRDYVGSVIGIGTEDWRTLDTMPDYQKLAYAGLLAPRGVSASRIVNLISGIFGIEAEVEEFIGTYLDVDPDDQTRLGAAHSVLGGGAMAGSRVLTVDTRFRLSLHVKNLREYENFLPGGHWADRLVDALSNAVGFEYDWEVELVLPRDCIEPSQLGGFGRLGWTTWVPDAVITEETPDHVRTRFSPIRDEGGSMLH